MASSSKKKRWFNVLRAVICAGALWFVIQGVTWRDRVTLADGTELVGTATIHGDAVAFSSGDAPARQIPLDEIAKDDRGAPMVALGLASAWCEANKWLLVLAVLLHFPVIFPQALRFKWLLSAQDIRIGYPECLRLSFAGNFLNFAAPFGSYGGDVFKAYFVSLHTEHKTEAVTTVFLDRIIGLSSLILVVTLIAAFSPATSRLAEFRPYMLGVLAVLVVGLAAYLNPWIRRYLMRWSWVERLPMFDHIQRMDRSVRKLAGHIGLVVAAVLITIALQALAMCAYFSVAMGLGLHVGISQALECFAYFYTGVVIQALPGPPQGLGTVELAYRYFFSAFGTASQIVCMALVIRIVALICSMPGLLVTMTGSYKPEALEEFEASLDDDESDLTQVQVDAHEIVPGNVTIAASSTTASGSGVSTG